MTRKILSGLCVVLLFLCVRISGLAEGGELLELSQSRLLYACSTGNTAYFYGFSNNTLCSVRVIPDGLCRSVTIDGVIRAVCHDDGCAYALFTTSHRQYNLLSLEMDSGNCRIFTIVQSSEILPSSFAVSGNEVFLLSAGAVYNTVESYSLSGEKLYSYSFSLGADAIFLNDGIAYAMTKAGDIYRLSHGNSQLCAQAGSCSECSDAGIGYVRTAGGAVVSLADGSTRRTDAEHAVMANGRLYTENSGLLFAAAGTKTAVLDNSFDYSVHEMDPETETQENRTDRQEAYAADEMMIVSAGTTVTALKRQYSAVSTVFDNDGSAVTSGILRTGYAVRQNGTDIPLAIRGDLNASGTVNSRDISILMHFLIDDHELSGVFAAAADWNGAGCIDNRDLVLLAQSVR